MKIQLPVNENPFLRSYAHHGYFQIIETSEDKLAKDNDIVAKVSVSNYLKENFHIIKNKIRYTNDSNQFIFYANKWNIDLDAAFYKELNQTEDEIEIRIDNFLKSGPYASIKVFASSFSINELDTYDKSVDSIDFGVCLGIFSKDGIYTSTQQYLIEKLYKPNNEEVILKLFIKDNCIYGNYKTKNKVSEDLLIKKISSDESFRTIGFAVCLGNNKYYENLFLNFINLEFYRYGAARLDFINSPIKNFTTFTTNYFIDVYLINEIEISKFSLSTLEYIKTQLSLGHYIVTLINDNINSNRTDENGCYFHENLIYGFDDDAQILNIFYYDNGLIIKSSISYNAFNSERNKKTDNILYVLNYNPHSGPLIFSNEILARKYEKYIFPQNCEVEHSTYEFINSVKGINCLETLKSEQYIRYLVKDIRISHVLYERAMINENRIEYLFARQLIDEHAYNKLKTLATIITKKTHLIRNLTLRIRMSKQIDTKKIQPHMNELFVLDKDFSLQLIDALNKCNIK